MANPTCNTTTLITNGACYRQIGIDVVQQKALLIYAKVLQLSAIGGTDYDRELTGTLLTDSACPPVEADHIRAANIAVAFANAEAAGAVVPTSIQTAIDAVKCLQHINGGLARLEQIDLLLNCKLGQHKAYPQ